MSVDLSELVGGGNGGSVTVPVIEPEPVPESVDVPITNEMIEQAVKPTEPEPEPVPEVTTPAAVSTNTPAAPEVVPEPVIADTRQAWVCVTPEGPRTNIRGEVCPIFRSDAHLFQISVVCPTCGGTTVRMVGPGDQIPAGV